MLLYVVFYFHDRAFSRELWGRVRRSRAAPLSRSGSVAFPNRGHLLSLPLIPAQYARSSFFVIRGSSSPDISRNIVKPFAKPVTLYRRLATINDYIIIFHVSKSILVPRVRLLLGVCSGQSCSRTAKVSNRPHWSERIRKQHGNQKQTARNPPFAVNFLRLVGEYARVVLTGGAGERSLTPTDTVVPGEMDFRANTNNFLLENRTLQEGRTFFTKRNYFFLHCYFSTYEGKIIIRRNYISFFAGFDDTFVRTIDFDSLSLNLPSSSELSILSITQKHCWRCCFRLECHVLNVASRNRYEQSVSATCRCTYLSSRPSSFVKTNKYQ